MQNDRFQREKEASEIERKRLRDELGHLRNASAQNPPPILDQRRSSASHEQDLLKKLAELEDYMH